MRSAKMDKLDIEAKLRKYKELIEAVSLSTQGVRHHRNSSVAALKRGPHTCSGINRSRSTVNLDSRKKTMSKKSPKRREELDLGICGVSVFSYSRPSQLYRNRMRTVCDPCNTSRSSILSGRSTGSSSTSKRPPELIKVPVRPVPRVLIQEDSTPLNKALQSVDILSPLDVGDAEIDELYKQIREVIFE